MLKKWSIELTMTKVKSIFNTVLFFFFHNFSLSFQTNFPNFCKTNKQLHIYIYIIPTYTYVHKALLYINTYVEEKKINKNAKIIYKISKTIKVMGAFLYINSWHYQFIYLYIFYMFVYMCWICNRADLIILVLHHRLECYCEHF